MHSSQVHDSPRPDTYREILRVGAAARASIVRAEQSQLQERLLGLQSKANEEQVTSSSGWRRRGSI